MSHLGPRAIANTIGPPAVLRELLQQELGTSCPEKNTSLDHDWFVANIRSSRRGVEGGPLGIAAVSFV